MGLVEKIFKNGEVIIKEGDIGKSFFMLTEGKAGVYANYGKNDLFRIAVIEPGEYFGEMAIIEEYPRSATVVAIGNVHAIEIPSDEMTTFFQDNPEQVLELIKHLSSRVKTMTDDYNESQVLLQEVRNTEPEKKNASLFSKIKKHIDTHQNNKNKLTEPNEDDLRKAFTAIPADQCAQMEDLPTDTILFQEGQADMCMYILHQGNIGFYTDLEGDDEKKLYELTPFAVFGELEMANEEPRTVSAVAETDSRVEIIDSRDLQEMVQTCPAKIDWILRYLSFRLRRLTIDFLQACKEITESYNK
ncbi:MAG: cyclic nucleotide-binding domain-containing protein [Clostridiales bacterium]|nr:cyclic nucleotide-binding domain-containing protein [Clostridiales bacterium]